MKDEVKDPWEGEEGDEIDYQPIIGILTQPKRFKNGTDMEESYILQSNDDFQTWSGSRTIAIPYNIEERALIDLLGNINGVRFTGGGLELIDKDGNQPKLVAKTKIKIYAMKNSGTEIAPSVKMFAARSIHFPSLIAAIIPRMIAIGTAMAAA